MDKIKSVRVEHFIAALLGAFAPLLYVVIIAFGSSDFFEVCLYSLLITLFVGLGVGYFRERKVRQRDNPNALKRLIITFFISSILTVLVAFIIFILVFTISLYRY